MQQKAFAMAGEAAQSRFEYRFMEVLNRLDVFLKEHLDYVFLVLVFAALALLIWWMIRRRPPASPGSGKIDTPLAGVFDFMHHPKPRHLRDEPQPPQPGRFDSGRESGNDPFSD